MVASRGTTSPLPSLQCLGLHLEDQYQTDNLAPFKIKESLPAGITLVSADDLETWYLDVKVLDANPLYLDKTFRLLFKFGDQYPIGMHLYKSTILPIFRVRRLKSG